MMRGLFVREAVRARGNLVATLCEAIMQLYFY